MIEAINSHLLVVAVLFMNENLPNKSESSKEKDENKQVSNEVQYSSLFRLLLREYFLQLLMSLTVITYRTNYTLIIKESFNVSLLFLNVLMINIVFLLYLGEYHSSEYVDFLSGCYWSS